MRTHVVVGRLLLDFHPVLPFLMDTRIVASYGVVARVGVIIDDDDDDDDDITPNNRAINSFLFPCVDNCRAANCAFNWIGFIVLISFDVSDGSI